MSKDQAPRDAKVKAEQMRFRSMIEQGSVTGATSVETAMAMQIEAAEHLAQHGIHLMPEFPATTGFPQ